MAIRLIKTPSGAKSIIQRAMAGMATYYGVVQVTNATGETMFFGAETPQELASVIRRARHAGKRAHPAGHDVRPIAVLWTEDEGLTPDGERVVGAPSLKEALLVEQDAFIWTDVIDGKKQRPHVGHGSWSTLSDKWNDIRQRMAPGRVYGGHASEVLAVGGDARLAWVDIDTGDARAVREWVNSLGDDGRSVVTTRSSSGRFHAFVRLDPSSARGQADVRRWLRHTMGRALYETVGSVSLSDGGCETGTCLLCNPGKGLGKVRSGHRIYLPFGRYGCGILPQALVADRPSLVGL